MTTKITGTGSYVPEQVITNDDLARIVDTNDEWIYTRTGIRERRISKGEGTTDLAVQAAKAAVQQAGIAPKEIDLIIMASISVDYCLPNGACQVGARIGASRAACYDLSAACSGFVFALNTAHAFISSGIYKTILVIGAESLSKLTDWSDRNTCVLFGDGAGAAVVQAADRGIMGIKMHSDGSMGDILSCGSRTCGNFLTGTKPQMGYVQMDGREVYKFSLTKVPELIGELLEETKVPIEDIRYFILHQANYRILEAVSRRLKIGMDRIPSNIERYGNTSGASVPILLDEVNRKGMLKTGDKLLLAGFGAGLTWGATLLEW